MDVNKMSQQQQRINWSINFPTFRTIFTIFGEYLTDFCKTNNISVSFQYTFSAN